MSYNIKCTFFIDKNGNQEIISKGIIDDLKIINSQRYSISFDDVNPTTDNIKLNNDEIWRIQYNKENGYIFDQNSFIQGALYYNGKIEEERKAIINLQNIINSTEYYRLNLNQRENVTEDLQGSNEAKEIFESCYLACRKMIDLFEYFEHE